MYALNCILTPPELVNSSDQNAGAHLAMSAELPERFTLIPNLPPVRDQGLKGCCVAHVVTCMKEEQERRDVNFKGYFSPEYIYNLRPNKPQGGMYIRDALQIVKDYGILPEKSYPYDYNTELLLSQRLQRKALNYRIKNFARVLTMDELKHALIESGACPVAFPAYKFIGKIWNPPSSEHKVLGYHAMVIVGWNLEGFVIRNSWGPEWGCGGYVIYPYEEWGAHCEIWTSYDESSQLDGSDVSYQSCWRRC